MTSRFAPFILIFALAAFTAQVRAQSPLPGRSSAPVPGTQTSTAPATAVKSGYRQLPLTAGEARQRIDELRAQLISGRAQDVQDRVYELCEWLTDAADAHYRMHLAFNKSDLTKNQAAAEKSLNQKFGQLKREAQLLKADVLIRANRGPEALSPLVEIVTADPRSATGQAAYRRLVDMGFSQEVEEPVASAIKPVK